MDTDELSRFLEERPYVLWAQDEEGNFYFRHEQYDDEHNKLKVTPQALNKVSAVDLDKMLVNGRNIEHITRITGYFSKVSGWNKGKKGELEDRHRSNIE